MSRSVFVVMPFSSTPSCTEEQWTDIYENVFRPAAEEAEYSCSRASPAIGSLIHSIIEKLHTSSVVLADLTDRNPNVFYELGIRHCFSRRTILTTQGDEHVPSDLKGYWYLPYGIRPGQVKTFKHKFRELLGQLDAHPERSDSPVSDYVARVRRNVLNFIQWENLRKLNALCTELTGNFVALQRLQVNMLSVGCLQHLLQTLYIDPGPELLTMAYELEAHLRRMMRSPAHIWTSGVEERVRTLLEKMLDVRQQVESGTFVEPAQPSFMAWKRPDLTPEDTLLWSIRHDYNIHNDFLCAPPPSPGILETKNPKTYTVNELSVIAPNPEPQADG